MRPDTSRALTSRFGPCPSFLHCPGLHDVADANLSNCSTRSSLPTSRVSLVSWWRALLDELHPPPFGNRKDVSSISRTHVTPGSCPSGRHCPGLHFAGDSICSTRARCHSDITRELGIFLPRVSDADLTSSPPHFLMWKWARTFKKCTCEIRFFTHSHLLLELLPKHLVTACRIASSRDLLTCSNVTTLLLLSAPCSLR